MRFGQTAWAWNAVFFCWKCVSEAAFSSLSVSWLDHARIIFMLAEAIAYLTDFSIKSWLCVIWGSLFDSAANTCVFLNVFYSHCPSSGVFRGGCSVWCTLVLLLRDRGRGEGNLFVAITLWRALKACLFVFFVSTSETHPVTIKTPSPDGCRLVRTKAWFGLVALRTFRFAPLVVISGLSMHLAIIGSPPNKTHHITTLHHITSHYHQNKTRRMGLMHTKARLGSALVGGPAHSIVKVLCS